MIKSFCNCEIIMRWYFILGITFENIGSVFSLNVATLASFFKSVYAAFVRHVTMGKILVQEIQVSYTSRSGVKLRLMIIFIS